MTQSLIQMLTKKVAMLQQIKALYEKLYATPTTLLHPMGGMRKYISQVYGEINPTWYRNTGHHIGTDYACAPKTKVFAPWLGRITTVGYSESLGNFCIYQYSYNGVTYRARFLHLSQEPKIGNYKRGAVIAYSGNTGFTKGPHCHVEVWLSEVRIDFINAKNWREMTIDPEVHYKN